MSDEANGAPAAGSPEHYAIGIAFGNSYSSIAHISGEGKVEVIANEEGDRQIPSVLSYIDGEEYHGTQAKAQLVRNSKNTVAYFRDFIGKDYKSIDPTPCHASAHPIEADGQICFSIRDTESEAENKVSVEEITARHLRRLKNSASDFVGKPVTAAVVAVPTDTNDEQKAALSKAAASIELEILQFMPEPIAALLAYDSRSSDSAADKNVLVADFGGTRSDVAVIASRGGMYSILATAHDYELGGVLLDQILADHFAKEFEKKHKSDPRKNERSLAKLKLESEAVKKALSQSTSATFSVESLADGVDFRSTINRSRYEILALKTFTRFTRLVEEAIKKADLDVLDIDEVIMSGGTSHTPKIARNIEGLFPESTQVLAPATTPTALNPSELSARGAALQASLIQEFDKEDIDQSTHEMVTVTPHLTAAIGYQVTGQPADAFTVIIPAETAVPARRSKTIEGLEGDVLVRICEGEREIKVTKPEPKEKPATNGTKEKNDDDEDDEDDSDFDEDDEPEEIREKVWKPKQALAEFVFKALPKGSKVEVMVNVDAELVVSITARHVGGKGGVRGEIKASEAVQNGSA
ncbi:Hsp70 protein that interacts with Zuo1p [Exophiala dermatitidis]|uniref:Heat shock 70kDa protein 5 n=2 Tax=Exophiala dermatitidis TaxID=5970 RepID=H6BWN9_EXODN|nr:heat shock 70kDa protein 5 [Exophiala dermatitidis NIH/UT8656]KAJ4511288.1 Hsp70 protein that interacts with Zuo1p [Exophiala dermatitidis]EHY56100.1 heat shock 70kDa protein 5 [Exophiala dermatitidis NIH/UT8656]KAJ4515490.1 Hsp70 protein that interacts with Zuo1p [Exophiala dermatitidis]KAJ4535898.1 Hsp70 protein that interacts with Zuo1p [Exophiala dermatitidis]KAJ4536453.1 Hsp70 protein that interacts with Zuo1p [Exophiala dermatitidis]